MSKTVFLVDDDETLLRVFSRFLRRMGLNVIEHARPDSLLLRLREGERPDLIITDYHMPVMTGGALAEEARSLGYRSPILLLSGRLGEVERSEAVTRYAEKPIGLTEFQTIVTELLAAA